MQRAGFFLLFAAMLLPPAEARGINTFVSPMHHPAVSDHLYIQTSESTLPSDGQYVEAPQARMMAPPPLRLTRVGKVMGFLHNLFPSGDANPSLHDPVSGSAIEKFGEAYAGSGPMGTGIAPH